MVQISQRTIVAICVILIGGWAKEVRKHLQAIFIPCNQLDIHSHTPAGLVPRHSLAAPLRNLPLLLLTFQRQSVILGLGKGYGESIFCLDSAAVGVTTNTCLEHSLEGRAMKNLGVVFYLCFHFFFQDQKDKPILSGFSHPSTLSF